MPITITDQQLQDACTKGVSSAINDMLRNGYSWREKVDSAIKKAVGDADTLVVACIREHLRVALQSQDVQKAVHDAVAKNIADKFGGAFQGVVIAAAKQIANEPGMQDMVRRMAAEVLQGPKA